MDRTDSRLDDGGSEDRAAELELLAQAVAGQRFALEKLLIAHQRRLMARIQRKLPRTLAGVVSPEDVLQDTYIEVFRRIQSFELSGIRAFYRWLVTIADNRVIDVARAHRAAKRGGGRERVELPPDSSSVAPLLDALHAHSNTPSRVAADHEFESAVHVALAALKPDYREALRLRFLMGLSVSETARSMKRSEWSIHKLCSRGLQRLRESLGEASRFLSRK